MKRNLLAIMAVMCGTLSISAQSPVLPEGMEILTPDGVELTTNSLRTFDKDKNIVIAGSEDAGWKIFFTAKESTHGEELWVSDGTKEGTRMVKDIYPGDKSSDVKYITRFNDKVVFQAVGNDEDGCELWISDGTESGTYMIMDINEIGDSSPAGITQVNENQFIFGAIDIDSELYGEEPQRWLWVSDGTAEGTKMIKDCWVKYPGTQNETDYCVFMRVGRKVFFKADSKDSEFTETLWVTDGTTEGTVMLTDINTMVVDELTGKTNSAAINFMTNVNNKWLFFKAQSEEGGAEPWYSDGTPEGTYQIGDFTPGVNENGVANGSGVFTTCVMGDYVYYRGMAPDNAYGIELIRTDGTYEGTSLVLNINKVPTATGDNSGMPDVFPYCVFDGYVWGKGQWGVNTSYDFCRGLELFYTNGGPEGEGSGMHSDLNPGVGAGAQWEGTVCGGSMYFRGQDQVPAGSQTWELFRIDNQSDEMPVKVMDLAEGIDYVHTLRNFNNDLVFTSVAYPGLFKYHYRKPNFDPNKDMPSMEIDFDGMSNVYNHDPNNIKDNCIENVDFKIGENAITIKTSEGVKGYELSDISGRVVANVKHIGTEVIVPTIGMTKGAYVVKVATQTGRSITRKVLVK